MTKWMQIVCIVPDGDGEKILHFARQLGFSQRDEDWCTEKRENDNATIDYAPAPEPADRKADWL